MGGRLPGFLNRYSSGTDSAYNEGVMELSQQIDILNGALALLRGTPEFERVQAVRDSLIDPYAGAPGAMGANMTTHHQKLVDLAFHVAQAATYIGDKGKDDLSLTTQAMRVSNQHMRPEDQRVASVHPTVLEELIAYLHTECPKPRATKIVVVVEGGMVTAVMADRPDADVTLRDFDNIEAGDDDPFEGDKDAEGNVNWDGAGYPCEVF